LPALALALVLGLSALLGELAVRLLVPSSRWRLVDATDDWRVDTQLGWTHQPNLDVSTVSDQFGWQIVFQTNPDGVQPSSARRAKAPGVLRIMLFGDSVVVGRSVPEPDRVHRQLEAAFRARGRRVEVINAGVQGYSTDQELLLMKRLLPLYSPDLVGLAVCDNDFEANQWPANYGTAKPVCRVLADGFVACIDPDPAGLTLQRLGRRNPLYYIQFSALYRYFQPTIIRIRMRLGKNTYAGTSLPPSFFLVTSRSTVPALPFFRALLIDMDETAGRHDARLFFYSHPSLLETWKPAITQQLRGLSGASDREYDPHRLERELQATAAPLAIPYCPLVSYFLERQDQGPFHLLPRDPHSNPSGYRLTSEALGACLSALGY
jgi:lysophospholipase L1-like esterase